MATLSSVQQNQAPSQTGVFIKTTGKLALSAVYLGAGLGMIALGTCCSVYAISKTNQFYFEEPQTGWPGQRPNLGFGQTFNKICLSICTRLEFASKDAVCTDLSTKGWKEIKGPESTAAAVGTTIVGTGGILFLSSYLVMAGVALIAKSSNTFIDAIF